LSQQVFRFKQFTLDQTNAPFKLCQDTCILGASTRNEILNPYKILDIGTGTGVLALMQAQLFKEAQIDAIEINPQAARIAKSNFSASPWSSRFNLHQLSFQDYISQHPALYDLIICNPPFYQGQLLSTQYQKNLAKHQLELDFSTLLKGVHQLLKPNGVFFCLISAFKKSNFDLQLREYNLHINKIWSVTHKPDMPVQRLVYSISRKSMRKMEHILYIKNADGDFTSEMKQLLKDFYLKF